MRDDGVITHDEVLRWLPTSIRGDFEPPRPFAALADFGISMADLERWPPPTRAEIRSEP